MSDDARNPVDDLRGASRLAVDTTRGVTNVVRDMHATIASGPSILGRPLSGPVGLITGLVYGTIRGVTTAVGATIDLGLAQLSPWLTESTPGPTRDALIAAVNGVVGDHLVATQNPLAIEMRATVDSHSEHLLVMLHGSCMSPRQWVRNGHNHGAVLAEAMGASRIEIAYNSGLHISTNGAQLSDMLEDLVLSWPTTVESITILGFSMGGLVGRSAAFIGERDERTWRRRLKSLAFVGTPHHGAPLERGGNWIDALLGVSDYSAPISRLGQIRSAGITDLRYGFTLDEHWQARDRFERVCDDRTPLPLPDDVACFAIAGTLGSDSDGIVPVRSALGASDRPKLELSFVPEHTAVVQAGHLDLLCDAGVSEQLVGWLA